MPEYPFSEKRKPWEFYEAQQEEALKNALNPELWAWLKEQTERERSNELVGNKNGLNEMDSRIAFFRDRWF